MTTSEILNYVGLTADQIAAMDKGKWLKDEDKNICDADRDTLSSRHCSCLDGGTAFAQDTNYHGGYVD